MCSLLSVDLPKYPGLLVVGKRVTRNQAAEILLRTDNWRAYVNDTEWIQLVDAAIGMSRADFAESIGVLELSYLHNYQIGHILARGPHGWCDWDGTIGCTGYNLHGKWPHVEDVLRDWKDIAETFPYLDLRCQLLNKHASGCDGIPKALAEFVVANGSVDMVNPGPLIRDPAEMPEATTERGCSIRRLRGAIAMLKAK